MSLSVLTCLISSVPNYSATVWRKVSVLLPADLPPMGQEKSLPLNLDLTSSQRRHGLEVHHKAGSLTLGTGLLLLQLTVSRAGGRDISKEMVSSFGIILRYLENQGSIPGSPIL